MFNIIRNLRRDKKSIDKELKRKDFVEFKGEVEIFGYRNGVINYYDYGENIVTLWAKHMTMHLLTGSPFTTHGTQRSFDSADHQTTGTGTGVNNDGTLLSGEQYFSDNSSPDFSLDSRWSKSTITPNSSLGDNGSTAEDMKYPFFPSKMLFGTGFEFSSWSKIPDGTNNNYKSFYGDLGWTENVFNGTIADSDNDYSSTWDGNSLTKTRSMNDMFSTKITEPVNTEEDFGIPGAIKNGTYYDSSIEREGEDGVDPGDAKTTFDNGKEYLKRQYQGIGKPSFIYPTRSARFFEAGSEVALTNDGAHENKITFTVVMPEQTGSSIFYPYNGYTLKVGGLFCDARILISNTVPNSSSQDDPDELDNYNKMPYGALFAKKYLSPVVKDHGSSLSIRWTIYL